MVHYITIAIIMFIISLYKVFNSKHPNDIETNFFKKIGIALIIALISPLIILGALLFFGIGITANGG